MENKVTFNAPVNVFGGDVVGGNKIIYSNEKTQQISEFFEKFNEFVKEIGSNEIKKQLERKKIELEKSIKENDQNKFSQVWETTKDIFSKVVDNASKLSPLITLGSTIFKI